MVWQWRRWEIELDLERGVIRSRDHETPIETDWDSLELKWLDIKVSNEEWIWLANFKNRLKYTYKDKKVEFKRDIRNKKFSFKKTFVVDGSMLIAREDLNKKCPVCTSDEVMESLL